MKKYLVLVLLVLLVLLVACTPSAPSMAEKDMQAASESAMMEKNAVPESMIQKDASSMMKTEESLMMEKDAMMKDNSIVMQKDTELSSDLIGGDISEYLLWNSALFQKANEDGKLIYLEFSANWCPVCKQQEKDLVAAFETLDNPNIIGFKIPYKDSETTDEHTALARKYGIAYQHTKVIIKDGKILLKNPEAWNTERFLTEVNQLG